MKRLVHFSLLFFPLGYMLPATLADDAMPPTQESPNEDGGEELDLAVQMTVQAFREISESLRAMQDAASTVREAERLRKAMSLRYKLYGMSFNHGCYQERCAAEVGDLEKVCGDELKRLVEKDFFGVMPVRAIFCADSSTLASTGETLRCANPLSKEEASALAGNRKEAIALYLEKNKWLEGGPGFTRGQAWVIKAGTDVVQREYHLLHTLWKKGCVGQSLHCVDGRYYDCLYILIMRDGEPYRLEQWFDITAYKQEESAKE